LSIELFFVVVEDEERLWLLFDHVVEISIAARATELALNHCNVVFIGNCVEFSDYVIPHHLCGVEDTATEIGNWIPTVRKRSEAAGRQQPIDLGDGIRHLDPNGPPPEVPKIGSTTPF